MGVERFYNKIVTQKRKISKSGHPVEDWTDISTILKCCIYPINPGDTIAFRSNYLQLNITHKMNCSVNEDIKIDDKIVCDTDEYIIKKINSWGKFYEALLSEVK